MFGLDGKRGHAPMEGLRGVRVGEGLRECDCSASGWCCGVFFLRRTLSTAFCQGLYTIKKQKKN